MKLGFICLNVPGHLNPMTTLARHLQYRNHEVVFQIGPVPSNAIIVKRAPQLELLKQTSVCITHAGLNTVLESLAQGVPQVAIAEADGLSAAAGLVEESLGLTHKVAQECSIFV